MAELYDGVELVGGHGAGEEEEGGVAGDQAAQPLQPAGLLARAQGGRLVQAPLTPHLATDAGMSTRDVSLLARPACRSSAGGR